MEDVKLWFEKCSYRQIGVLVLLSTFTLLLHTIIELSISYGIELHLVYVFIIIMLVSTQSKYKLYNLFISSSCSHLRKNIVGIMGNDAKTMEIIIDYLESYYLCTKMSINDPLSKLHRKLGADSLEFISDLQQQVELKNLDLFAKSLDNRIKKANTDRIILTDINNKSTIDLIKKYDGLVLNISTDHLEKHKFDDVKYISITEWKTIDELLHNVVRLAIRT